MKNSLLKEKGEFGQEDKLSSERVERGCVYLCIIINVLIAFQSLKLNKFFTLLNSINVASKNLIVLQ